MCWRKELVPFLAAAAGCAALISVTSAGASFPGANGKIIFERSDFSSADIWSMNADGTGATQLTSASGFNQRPSWSPDGSTIAFASNRLAFASLLFVMDPDGSNQGLVDVGSAGEAFEPTWSPDGSKIAFGGIGSGSLQVYVCNADGSGVAQLTAGPAANGLPSWSPDGTKIAFTSWRNPPFGEIYVMNADGTDQTRLSNNSDPDDEADWSPTGDKVAFTSFRDGQDEIYTMNPDGTDQTRLTFDLESDSHPAWSPDGSKIVFNSSRGGAGYDIWVMSADGAAPIRLTTSPDSDVAPNWQPVLQVADLSLSLNGDLERVKKYRRITYTVAISNLGPADAPGVTATDTVPEGTAFFSAHSSAGSCVSPPSGGTGTVTCDLGLLASGASATVELVVTVLAKKGTVLNTAHAASVAPDDDLTNNSVSLELPVR